MKACKFPKCGFKAKGECETLDKKHLYCSCGAIVHLNIRTPIMHIGMCGCGNIVEEEYKTGKICFYKYSNDKLVDVFEI